MQNIPIIISEKVLKKVFIEVVDEINKFCVYKYEIIDQYIKNIQNSSAIIIDLKALESIDVPEIKNQKLFIINDNSKNTSVGHSNQTLINTPFKIYDLFILVDKNIVQTKKLEQQKINYEDRIQNLKTEIEDLAKDIDEARQTVDAEMLRTYDRVKKVVSRAPYLAPLKDQKCSGCNLRVSNDVISTALVEQKLTQCDQCGRIVYVER